MSTKVIRNKLNWIKAFSIAEDELRDELYEKCSIIYTLNEKMLTEIYDTLVNTYNIETVKSLEELIEAEIIELTQGIIDKHKEDILEAIRDAYEFSVSAPDFISYRCSQIAIIRANDLPLIKKRLSLTKKRIISQIEFFIEETVLDFCNSIEDYLEFLIESIETLDKIKKVDETDNKIEEDIHNSEDKPFKTSKIFCHKKMQKLAIDNGYSYKWSNGRHDIFEHKTSKKIVVIPANTLGLGLSIAIQKQILKNAI